MVPNNRVIIRNETAKFATPSSLVNSGTSPPTQVATAASAVLTTSETSSRKPVAATSPMAAALAITSRVMVSPFGGGAFQISFSAVCSSANTPLAVSSRVTMLTMVATVPVVRLAAPLTIACTASALARPTRPSNWSAMAPSTACWPKTRPAMAVQISSRGAMEKIV